NHPDNKIRLGNKGEEREKKQHPSIVWRQNASCQHLFIAIAILGARNDGRRTQCENNERDKRGTCSFAAEMASLTSSSPRRIAFSAPPCPPSAFQPPTAAPPPA